MEDATELEALDHSQEVLKGYDPSTDTWAFAKEGAFWNAVKHAHALGYRGQGRRVAIIDSGCNLAIPRLSRQVHSSQSLVAGDPAVDPINHGTAVALLLTDVAPECTLDIYRVVNDEGRLDLTATIEALDRARESDAAVVNLSMGIRRLRPLSDHPAGSNPLIPDPQEVHKRVHADEDRHCPLCQAASRVAATGKLVFAAVGNSIVHHYCPARAGNVCAVGFQRRVVQTPSAGKEIRSLLPQFEQSLGPDLMLLQMPGSHGSSFSCPLYAGVGALGLSGKELFAYVRAYKAEVYPLRVHGVIDTTMTINTAPPPMLSDVERWYLEAAQALPHAHCELQARLRPDLPLTDPRTCPFCGIFAGTLCTMFGWWLQETGRGRDAWMVSEMAHHIAPWDSHALAHLGSLAHAMGDYPRAIGYLAEAIRRDPDNHSAQDALSQLRRGEANEISGPLQYLSPRERAALIMMPQWERSRLRQRSVMNRNKRYYIATGALLLLYLNFPSVSVLRWLLVPFVIFATWRAVRSFMDLKVGWMEFKMKSWQQEPGSARVKYEMNRLNKMLAASAVCFLMAAIALMVIIVEF